MFLRFSGRGTSSAQIALWWVNPALFLEANGLGPENGSAKSLATKFSPALGTPVK